MDDESDAEMVDGMGEGRKMAPVTGSILSLKMPFQDADCELHLASSDPIMQVLYLTPRLQL